MRFCLPLLIGRCCVQLKAAGDPGPGFVPRLSTLRWETDRLPPVPQPEEPG